MKAKSRIRRLRLVPACFALALAVCAQGWGQTIIYVNADAPSGGDGTNWASAYRHPLDALSEANGFPEPRNVQIWIVRGTYMLDGGLIPNGTGVHEPGSGGGGFNMTAGIGMYGGLVGTEEALSDRTLPIPDANLTVLSGDKDNNDVVFSLVSASPPASFWGGTYADNDGPVVQIQGGDCTLDGLLIRGGKSGTVGGGVHVNGHHSTIVRCTLYANYAAGAVQHGQFGFPQHGGGGLAISAVHDCTVLNSVFVGNWAGGGAGGAVSIFQPRSLAGLDERAGGLFVNCLFVGNWASEGGGVSLYSSWKNPNPEGAGRIDASIRQLHIHPK